MGDGSWGENLIDMNLEAVEHRVYGSFQEVEGARAEWDGLVERVQGDVFSTYDWCSTWWRHYGHERSLQLHMLRVANTLVAILPLFSETHCLGPSTLRLVRVVGCDHSLTTCGLIIHPNWLIEAIDVVLKDLESHSRGDLLQIGPLPGY